MLLIGNLNLFVYFGIKEGIQILTIVILAIVTVVYGLVLAIVPSESMGGPSCSAKSNECCNMGNGYICVEASLEGPPLEGPSQSCDGNIYVFDLSID